MNTSGIAVETIGGSTKLLWHNGPYSYSQYWTGTSLKWRPMRGNLFKCKWFLIYFPAPASIASQFQSNSEKWWIWSIVRVAIYTAIKPIDLIGLLDVVPNSNPLRIKRFVSGICISFECECHILMQMQHTKNFNLGRSELGTTVQHWVSRLGLLIHWYHIPKLVSLEIWPLTRFTHSRLSW